MAEIDSHPVLPEGHVLVPGKASEIVARIPAERHAEVRIRAGYGVIVPAAIAEALVKPEKPAGEKPKAAAK